MILGQIENVNSKWLAQFIETDPLFIQLKYMASDDVFLFCAFTPEGTKVRISYTDLINNVLIRVDLDYSQVPIDNIKQWCGLQMQDFYNIVQQRHEIWLGC